MRARVPVAVRGLDALSARALGVAGSGALLVRPDGVPAGLWADATHAAELETAVAAITVGGNGDGAIASAGLAKWAA